MFRRSFSAREEPVLNFLSERVINGGGDILEHAADEPVRPPRPASTPITHSLQQQQQQQRQQQPQQQPQQPTSFLSEPPPYDSLLFHAIDDVPDRSGGVSWRDSGVEASLSNDG